MLKNLLYLTIFTTFVVSIWIGLTIFQNITSTSISGTAQVQITPLNPTFNMEAVNTLKQRKQIATDLTSQEFQNIASEEATESAGGDLTQETPITISPTPSLQIISPTPIVSPIVGL